MARLSFKRHRFPPDVIRHAVRLTSASPELPRRRRVGSARISVSYETVRCWTTSVRRLPPKLSIRLRLTAVASRRDARNINGERTYLARRR
jgi:hypothetical protein